MAVGAADPEASFERSAGLLTDLIADVRVGLFVNRPPGSDRCRDEDPRKSVVEWFARK